MSLWPEMIFEMDMGEDAAILDFILVINVLDCWDSYRAIEKAGVKRRGRTSANRWETGWSIATLYGFILFSYILRNS